MDVSSVYVKMCEKAVEIQAKWITQLGDYILCPNEGAAISVINYGQGAFYGFPISGKHQYCTLLPREQHIWLPRQDQLQEMVLKQGESDFSATYNTLKSFITYLCGGVYWDGGISNKFFEAQSMEQLWLAFVIGEKYGKVWDSKKEKWLEEK